MNVTATTFDKVTEVIVPYLEDESLKNTIQEGTDLINDLKINSVHMVDIILDLETAFDTELDDDAFSNLKTVGEIVNILQLAVNAG